MKTLRDYIVEAEQWVDTPAAGDDFEIELEDGTLIETYIMATEGSAILLDATDEIYSALGQWAELCEDVELDEDQGAGQVLAKAVDDAPVDTMSDIDEEEMTPDQIRARVEKNIPQAIKGMIQDYKTMDDNEFKQTHGMTRQEFIQKLSPEARNYYMGEAKYQGREVPLGKPMAGDVKKSKVYVRDPATGNVKKVNFGDPNMKIKKSNPARRKSFRARHNCANPGPRTKARYWSCRAW